MSLQLHGILKFKVVFTENDISFVTYVNILTKTAVKLNPPLYLIEA